MDMDNGVGIDWEWVVSWVEGGKEGTTVIA